MVHFLTPLYDPSSPLLLRHILFFKSTWAWVAPVLCLSQVSGARRVGEPGSVLCARGVDVWAHRALEGAPLVLVTLGAVAGDARAQPGDLDLHSGLVLDAPGDVCPGAVLLYIFGHINNT